MNAHRTARRSAGIALVGGLLLVVAPAPSNSMAAAGASSILPPAVPAQSGPPPGTCSRAAAQPDTWTKVVETDAPDSYSPNPPPRFQVAVDPWRPCLMYRATSQQDVDRSLDSGKTWQPVFHDTASAVRQVLPTSPVESAEFAASDLRVPRQDSLLMAESGNGDAVLRSDDQGFTWRLADVGLEGRHIVIVEAAPSKPDVLYAVVDQSQTDPVVGEAPAPIEPFGLYVSRDGGTTWQPGVFPAALTTFPAGTYPYPRPHLTVDPEQPGRLWMFAELATLKYSGGTTQQTPTQSAVLQSTDFGTTWTVMTPAGSGVIASQLLAVRTPDHQLRLYCNLTMQDTTGGKSATAPTVSFDEGAHWEPLPVTPLLLSSLAVDPADGNRMVYLGYVHQDPLAPGEAATTGNTVLYTVTDDGWTTMRTGTPMRLAGAVSQPPVVPLQRNARTDDPRVLLQADRFGTFYLLARYDDLTTIHQALFALTPVGPAGTAAATTTGAAPGSTPQSPGAPPGQPSTSQMETLRTCSLPAEDNRDFHGSLSFDGDFLLYTSINSVSEPYTGTILRLDPQTCAAGPPLTVHFAPADIAAVEQRRAAQGKWSTPVIDTIAYDPGHDVIWMSLADAQAATASTRAVADPVPVFSATVERTAGSTPSNVDATLRFFSAGGYATGLDLLAYDYSDDTLWSRANLDAAHVDLDGRPLPSCWDSAHDPGGSIATWVLGGPGRLYVQSEDDVTLWEVDAGSCQLLHTFQHRNFGEPTGEDEQMACDAFSFGPDSAYAATHRAQSVIWLRDGVNHLVVAYGIPDGVCPLPTATRYLGSGASPKSGQTRFCAELSRRNVPRRIAGRPLLFTVAGQELGTGTTDAAGIACLDHPLTLGGGAYPVVARFLGDSQYLPSQDSGTLAVIGGTVPPPLAAALVPGQPASGQPPEPGPAQQAQAPQAASQAETQAQVQAQSQAQSQSQAQAHTATQVQPGMSLQRRTREQVATQTAGVSTQTDSMLATRFNCRPAWQALQLAVAGLLLGAGVLVRRPQRAPARRMRRGR